MPEEQRVYLGVAAPGDGPGGARHPSLFPVDARQNLEALHQTGGHQQRAANLLGVSRRTLRRKLKLYDAETEKDSLHAS
jgi:DNA-binding NtrC family response regulator